MRATVTHELVRSLLDYDVATGEMRWRVDRNQVARAGKRAGYQRKDGYWVINIGGRCQLLHRLAWLWMTGGWPTEMIDHINGDPSDNSFGNLRQATRSQNMMNMGVAPHNTSGHKGVSFHKNYGKWEAYITVNRQRRRVGYFTDLAAAVAARASAERESFGAFARLNRSGTEG